MSCTVIPIVPKALENTAIQYWTGVYEGDAEQMAKTLAPDVQVEAHSCMNERSMPPATLVGREKVIEQALKMNEAIQSIDSFDPDSGPKLGAWGNARNVQIFNYLRLKRCFDKYEK